MLTPAQDENVQRGPTSSVLNVSRSRADLAAAKVPISLGSSGSGSTASSFARGSCGSGILMPPNVHPPRSRCKR